MSTRLRILRQLADAKLHSGEAIGRRLGITRAAVSKGVKALIANGLDVRAVRGVGYQCDVALTPLDRRALLRLLGSQPPTARRIEVLETVDSTNRYLLARALADPEPSGIACLAETQPRGRGRRGKSWIATPYENLMLSMAWRFAVGPAMVAGLSLAAGVGVARALEDYGVTGIGLKWPNDVLWSERKLAGLLVDVHGEASGPCTVVLGVGVNCRIAPADAKRIDQPWVDLHTITGQIVDRNRLGALLLQQLHEMFATFAVSGFGAFQAEWDRRHLYRKRAVCMRRGEASFEGIVDGIDEHGALRLRDGGGQTHVFHSGEISLRPAS